MAFLKPKWLVEALTRESSLLYGLVPFAILVLLWELKNWLVYRFAPQAPSDELVPDFVPRALSIGTDDMTLYVVAFALVWMLDVVLFTSVVDGLSRVLRLDSVSARVAATCYLFCSGTFGTLALLADLIFELRPSAGIGRFCPLPIP
jgi:hypothetical protein